ncbi:sigma factor-like helix-turn-helix DNA-binding protein [Neobacillus sp. PS3-40]|uniref:RNA polymerase sigma factor n=1 Tax=Neobacillus sp. PS3-40 TaxID=3070679 RepID=UPI0027E129BD|nr:sigma factor-like helix-turn-helix DNA-binding protein [Neobacillus sp. PS3-40]WML44331.1 sigma factor-like helix-turn-helix DNA-binding protein [Neobacillus sp. PS3-40]
MELNLNEGLLEINSKDRPETILLEKEKSRELGYALSQLKPHFQELMLLKYHSGLMYAEISKLLEMSVSSIKTNIFRERKKLANIFKEANHE